MKVFQAFILAFVICDNVNGAAIGKEPPLGSERSYSIDDYLCMCNPF